MEVSPSDISWINPSTLETRIIPIYKSVSGKIQKNSIPIISPLYIPQRTDLKDKTID